MLYRAAADLVVLAHFGFLLFVVFGAALVWRRGAWAWLHLPAALWGAWITVSGGICPLTYLENWLLTQAGDAVPNADFIERMILPILYPAGLGREQQGLIGLLVLLGNGVAYLALWRRWRRGRSGAARLG